jgi:hypothetical protein
MTKAFFVTARCIAWSALAWAMAGGPCHAQVMLKKMGLSDLTGQADSIFVAKCAKSQVVYRNGALITQYQLEPTEVWKEGATLAKASSGKVTLEQIGGSITSPIPITLLDSSSVVLKEGQQALLFTKMPDATTGSSAQTRKAATLSASSPRVVGGAMGAFSVIKDPTTGRDLVTPGTLAVNASQAAVAAMAKATRVKASANTASANASAAGSATSASSASASTTAKASSSDSVTAFEPLDGVRTRVQALIDAASKKK